MNLSPNDIRRLGLGYARMTEAEQASKGVPCCVKLFTALYGSKPIVVADMWGNLCSTQIPGALLTASEKTHHGFKLFLMANYFLWTYPRNARLMEVHFGPIPEKDTRGEPFWKWIKKIQAMLPTKIHWLPRLDDPNCETFIVSIDGTDCRTNEPRNHPLFNIDKRMYSDKFHHAAWKYEIAVALYEDKIVWVNGPFKGGTHDLTMLREGGLLNKIQPGKMGFTNRGY